MSRLILKENVNRVIQKAFDDGRISYKDGQYLMDRIAEIPDGLIRCKDCKYCYSEGFVNVRNVCEKHYDFGNVDDDWFCADGEMKSDA